MNKQHQEEQDASADLRPGWLLARRRMLLKLVADGRIYTDSLGAYFLDRSSNLTIEFKTLERHGLVKPAPDVYFPWGMGRVVWLSDEAWAFLGIEVTA